MIRIITTLLAYSFAVLSLYAQKEDNRKDHKIGITFSSFGENEVVRATTLDGEAGYNGDKFFTLGVSYNKWIYTDWLSIETGIEYSQHTFIVRPNLPPDLDRAPYPVNYSLLSLPIGVKANFLKMLFVNGGFLLDIDASTSSPIDDQNGLGFYVGMGMEYDFSPGASLFINPYQKIHALLPLSMDKNRQKILESGLRVGVMIDF